jgi:hypothetical protein
MMLIIDAVAVQCRQWAFSSIIQMPTYIGFRFRFSERACLDSWHRTTTREFREIAMQASFSSMSRPGRKYIIDRPNQSKKNIV